MHWDFLFRAYGLGFRGFGSFKFAEKGTVPGGRALGFRVQGLRV